MKKVTQKATSKPKRTPVINVKTLDAAVYARIQRRADQHAEGNMSAWLRHTGQHYAPKKGERIKLKA